MSFSNEDKLVWVNSEVMKEFEKIAQEIDLLNGPSEEAFLPIDLVEEDDESWEDEEEDLEKAISDAAQELTGGSQLNEEEFLEDDLSPDVLKTELASLYMSNLLSNLQDLAHDLAERGHIKVARKIEVTINTIKDGGLENG